MTEKTKEENTAREIVSSAINKAGDYASKRKFAYAKYTKKISPHMLKDEIEIARIVGELAAFENLFVYIKERPDITVEHILDSLTLTMEDFAEYISLYLDGKKTFDREYIVKALNLDVKGKKDE